MTVASKKNTQVWLITGSSRGLGRALAEAVLAAGHRLVATARNPEQLAELAQRYGDRVRAVALDVTDERASITAVQTAVDVFGRLDVLPKPELGITLVPLEDGDELLHESVSNIHGRCRCDLHGHVHNVQPKITAGG